MSCGIYQFTNKINGKIYIGQSICIERRKRAHYTSTDSSPFHQAIRKYGKENFELIILEECSKEQLNEREIFWIKQKHSENKQIGYNRGPGGEGGSGTTRAKEIEQYSLDEKLITTYSSLTEASYKTGIPSANISRCCHLKSHSAGGYKWKYAEDTTLDYPKVVPNYTKITGRPSARDKVLNWKKENPQGTPKQCRLATGLCENTVYKYWKQL